MDELVEALRLHAFDNCGARDIETHIANIAADRIESLTAQLAEARTEGFKEGVEAAAKVADSEAASAAFNSDHAPEQPDRYYLAEEVRKRVREAIRNLTAEQGGG